jgi:hypothetical protein
LIPILVISLPANAGRNADGALIVHTNDAVSYTPTGDYCQTMYLPSSCEDAVTRTDKDENTPAVIWLLAAFPDTSSPAVTTIQFGIEHNLPANEGYFEAHGKCAELEMPDAGWPETGFGNPVSFGSTTKTDLLFCYYWFAAYGFEGAYLGTTTYPSTEEAKFVDDSSPPVEDLVLRFGTVHWWTSGANSCPSPEGGDESGGLDHSGEEDAPPDQEDEDVSEGPTLSSGGLAYLRLATASDSLCFQVAHDLRQEHGVRVLAAIGPDAVICRLTDEQLQTIAQDSRVVLATRDPISGLPPIENEDSSTPVDTRRIWNYVLSAEPDTSVLDASAYCGPPPGDRTWNTPESNPERQTSVFMMREVGVQVIFVESADDGTCNPDSGRFTENWSQPQRLHALAEIQNALTFGLARLDDDSDLVFRFLTPLTEEISYEPITMEWYDTRWQEAVFANLGYTTGTHLERAYAFDNDQRSGNGFDWSFTCLMVDNECDSDGLFPGGYPSYAYRFGPYTVILYSDLAGGMARTVAHETCHIFGASDEYQNAPDCHDVPGECTDGYGYLHAPNQNCYYCTETQVPCIMRGSGGSGQYPMCQWTKKQIGWWDNDGDGPLDPIDHRNAGKLLRLGSVQAPLVVGDRVDLRKSGSGTYVKTIPVSNMNSDRGVIVWDGVDYSGDAASSGEYVWYRNGTEQGTEELVSDLDDPALTHLEVVPNNDPREQQLLKLGFSDEDTHGCDVRVRTHLSGTGTEETPQILDEFLSDTTGSGLIQRGFRVDRCGDYDLDIMLWDVGGGHNASGTTSFRVGTTAEVGGEKLANSRMSLGIGVPNPAAERVRWWLDAVDGRILDIRIVGVDGRCVRSLKSGPERARSSWISWDGRDNAGQMVASGRYYLVVDDVRGRRVQGSAVLVR